MVLLIWKKYNEDYSELMLNNQFSIMKIQIFIDKIIFDLQKTKFIVENTQY